MANPIVTGYSTNDYFYTHTDNTGECKNYTGKDGNTDSEKNCHTNKTLATSLEKTHVVSSSTENKYKDTLMLYNRELIITVNLIIGICGLLYYIYVNKDVLPAVPTSLPTSLSNIKMPEMPKAFPNMNVAPATK